MGDLQKKFFRLFGLGDQYTFFVRSPYDDYLRIMSFMCLIKRQEYVITFSCIDKGFSLSEDQMEVIYVLNNKNNTLTSLKDFEYDSAVMEKNS